MNRTSPLARFALIGALVVPVGLGVATTAASADVTNVPCTKVGTTTTCVIAPSEGGEVTPTSKTTYFNQTFDITSSDGIGTLSGANGGNIVVDDVLEIDNASTSATVFTHDFSDDCSSTTGDVPIPPHSLPLQKGLNVLTLKLSDKCGVSYGNPELDLTVNNGTVTPVTTTTSATPGTPASQGSGTGLIVGPDLKAVSYLAAPAGCGAQLKGDAGFAKVLTTACTYLSKSSDPKPAKTQTAASWAKLIKSKNYRALLDLPPADVVCSNGTALGAVVTGNPTYSTGYVRKTVGSSAKAAGVKYLDAKGIFASHLPTIKVSKTDVVVTYRTAFQLPFVPNEYAATHHSAAYGYVVLQESIGCNGTYAATVTTSDLPSAVVYVNGKSFASIAQNATGLLAFAKAGGTGNAKTGHGLLDPHCKISVLAGQTKVPAKPTTAQCTVAITKGYLT